MIKHELWAWIKTIEVVCRPALTYLVRPPDEIKQKLRRDQGVEYHLTLWHHKGRLGKHPVPPYVAYYLPRRKPGRRPNLAHDLLAGLVAAKLYADIKGRATVALSRDALDGLLPDWTLTLQAGDTFRYYLEFHSRHNPDRALADKLARYHGQLQANEFVLLVVETPTFVTLASEQVLLTNLDMLLQAANSWQQPIWYWGEHDGRHRLLET